MVVLYLAEQVHEPPQPIAINPIWVVSLVPEDQGCWLLLTNGSTISRYFSEETVETVTWLLNQDPMLP